MTLFGHFSLCWEKRKKQIVPMSSTPNPIIEKILKNKKIPYAITPKGSHSVTTNAGIQLVTNDKFILMDSDCVFAPGAIRMMGNSLNEHLVVNGRIIFEHDHSFMNYELSECRDFDNRYELPAYKPGLGFHKDIRLSVGSWFNPRISFCEDAELSYRIYESGITIKHIDEPCVYHSPTTLKHNFWSCFHYGLGDYVRFNILDQKNSIPLLIYEIQRYKVLLKEKKAKTFLFMLANDFVYYIGYLVTMLRHRLSLFNP